MIVDSLYWLCAGIGYALMVRELWARRRSDP